MSIKSEKTPLEKQKKHDAFSDCQQFNEISISVKQLILSNPITEEKEYKNLLMNIRVFHMTKRGVAMQIISSSAWLQLPYKINLMSYEHCLVCDKKSV